jgi:hypothetical protein
VVSYSKTLRVIGSEINATVQLISSDIVAGGFPFIVAQIFFSVGAKRYMQLQPAICESNIIIA